MGVYLAHFALLLAEVSAPDIISGSAGWVGTGLLGSVLAWLMFVHLPGKDKMIKEILELGDARLASKDTDLRAALKEKDQQIEVLLGHKWTAIQQMGTDHRETIKNLAAEFRAVIVETNQHCDRQEARLMEWIDSLERSRPKSGEPGTGAGGANKT